MGDALVGQAQRRITRAVPRQLRVEFRTEDAFRREYIDNISNGGIFIATREAFEVREPVSVALVLSANNETIALDGEVVHCVPPELASTGASPGVAIQFALDAEQIRERFGALAPGASASLGEQGFGAGRRASPRSRLRVIVQIGIDGHWVDGRTRNISSSGVLIRLVGEPLPVGRSVQVCLTHPVTYDEIDLDGVVRRHVDTGETCLGIEFRISETRRVEFDRFLAGLRSAEHNRHLGGIRGPIADLGMERLIKMFGGAAPFGMLTVTRMEEEGVVEIDGGLIRAQLGRETGADAMRSLLQWPDGTFEFVARIEPGLTSGDAIALSELFAASEADPPSVEALDAQSELELVDIVVPPDAPGEQWVGDGLSDADPEMAADEVREDVPDDIPYEAPIAIALTDHATLSRGEAADDLPSDDFSKTEQALLDLASAGVTIGKALEIIPEPEADVRAALTGLIAMGAVTIY
jgi:Tfp pilus assembly protein PilZ